MLKEILLTNINKTYENAEDDIKRFEWHRAIILVGHVRSIISNRVALKFSIQSYILMFSLQWKQIGYYKKKHENSNIFLLILFENKEISGA